MLILNQKPFYFCTPRLKTLQSTTRFAILVMLKSLQSRFNRICVAKSEQYFLPKYFSVKVNICQKHLFLYQLSKNMTTDCSLNYEFSTWKFLAQNMLRTCCVHKLFWMSKQKTIFLHSTFSTCSELGIFMYWIHNSRAKPEI